MLNQIFTKLKTQIGTSQKLQFWQNSKTQIATKLKHSNCDQTQKLKIVTKLKKNSNFDNTQKLKLWLFLKTQKCDKNKFKLWQNLRAVIVNIFSKNNFTTLTTDEMFEGQCFSILAIWWTGVFNYQLARNYSGTYT